MAHFSLSPGFVKFRYEVSGITHTHTFGVIPSGAISVGVEPDFVQTNGVAVAAQAGVDAYQAVLRPLYHTSVTFIEWEFWSQPEPEDDPLWVFGADFTNPLGTSTNASLLAHQTVATYRTFYGSYGRIDLLESSVSAVSNAAFYVKGAWRSGAPAALNGLRTYLLGTTNIVHGRDNGWPVGTINYSYGVNDALKKRRNFA